MEADTETPAPVDNYSIQQHSNTRLMAWDYPGEPVPEKQKPIWILLKQETMSGSGISWTAPQTYNHARTPPLSFLQATNSVKALKALTQCTHKNARHVTIHITSSNINTSNRTDIVLTAYNIATRHCDQNTAREAAVDRA